MKKQVNLANFYAAIRQTLFRNRLLASQIKGMDAIINEWNINKDLTDLRWLAYMLATTYHETAQTMQPIEEYGKGRGKAYGRKVKMTRVPYTLPNKLYYGRGFVQLTWYENYAKMGRLFGIDLLNNPELALRLDVSTKILFEGMTKGDSNFGDFTGRSLEMYFNAKVDDPINARRIINGRDKALTISKYHNQFLAALRA